MTFIPTILRPKIMAKPKPPKGKPTPPKPKPRPGY